LQRIAYFTLLSLAALMTMACEKGQEPTMRALDQIRGVLEPASIDGQKYLPEKVVLVQDDAAKLRRRLTRKTTQR
jgi:hypothetical protein